MTRCNLHLTHLTDGPLGRIVLPGVPRRGEWILVGENTYVVTQVIWSSEGYVSLMLDDPSE